METFKEKSEKKHKKAKKTIKEIEEEIDKLKKGKVAQDTFDAEINFIKNLLNKHSGDTIDMSSMGPQFNANEVN